MTDDNIKLPVLATTIIPGLADWLDDIRIEAIRYDRERRAKVEVNPVVHSRTLRLTDDGGIYQEHENVTAIAVIPLRWTDSGHAWIESARNRELAGRLRHIIPANDRVQDDLDRAADALDGGER